ncbi:MAG: hypothetical protein UMU75_05245 [Halomonas sp.]|nr:hypothetical protein [Halomonas sp.]
MQRLSLDRGVLKVRDLAGMKVFCSDVLRLPLILASPTTALFELGTDSRGHSQVMMLIADAQGEPPRPLSLEVNEAEFPDICHRLCQHGARLFQSENSSAPGCAWRILSCAAPEGHRLIVVSIDPMRCRPASATLGH